MSGCFRHVSVKKNCMLVDALEVMDDGGLSILFIIDDEERLIGVFNDIDLRDALLNIGLMNRTIEHFMNKKPITISIHSTEQEILAIKKKHFAKQIIPVLDDGGHIVTIEKTRLAGTIYSNPVIILAGGMGKRLMPTTKSTPKPMVYINGRPLLEITVRRLRSQGFRNIYISLNYRGDQIKEHFGDGSNFGLNIKYIEEPIKLGTAGPIALIEKIAEPCLILNGDVLTKVSFANLINYHLNHGDKLTTSLYKYDFQVPYGVVGINDCKIIGINEKPVKKFFVNAGIYVMDPCISKYIPKNQKYSMTDLIEELVKRNIAVRGFPLREYWLDIGSQSEYQKAKKEFKQVFEDVTIRKKQSIAKVEIIKKSKKDMTELAARYD
ncbi:nucleotidyltransferase family protein [Planctomycetota bacterium]